MLVNSEENTGSTLSDFTKAKQLLEKLKVSKSDDNDGDSENIHTEFKESELRDVFEELNQNEKMLVLYEAILSNASGIAYNEHKLDFFKKTEKISITTWFKKVMIVFFAFMGIIAFSTFVFMIIKNGALNDISFVASFLKTVNEVLKVIFLTK